VTVEDDKSKKSDIVEEMPVEQSADVADLENAVTTVNDGENEDNAGEFLMFLLVYCIIVQ
jgi:ABC-type molybdate transport system substrate-binding protein